MKKIVFILLMIHHTNMITAIDDELTKETETTVETTEDDDTTIETIEKNIFMQSSIKNQDTTKLIHKNYLGSEKKLFINGQDNPLSIIVTDKDNKQHFFTIPAGTQKLVYLIPFYIKKIVCKGNYENKDIAITGSDLLTHSVFMLNLENKVEKFHCIDIKQKIKILGQAKKAIQQAKFTQKIDEKLLEKLMKNVDNIQEYSVYLL